MKITKQEVKTMYSIEFDLTDFTKIYLAASNDPCLLGAFADYDLSNDSMDYIKNCFQKLARYNNGNDLKYIVSKLGFDGVENYGMMKTLMNGKQVYRIHVYNYGEVYL